MSVHVIEWVLQRSTVEHRGDLLVLIVLASHAHDDGEHAFPTVETIAAKARLTRRGAQLALRRLEAAGAIERTGRGAHGQVRYRVVMAAEPEPEREPERAAAMPPTDAKPLRGGEVTSRGRSDFTGEVGDAQGRSERHGGAKGSSPEPSVNRQEPSPSVELALDGRTAAASPNGNGHAPNLDPLAVTKPTPADADALADEQPTPAASSRAADVRAVFAAWIEATGRTDRTILDGKRRRLIEQRLRDFPAADLIDAVRGWRESPHHRGENAARTVYNDLGLLLRDAEHVERFRDLARGARQPVAPRAVTEAEIRRRRDVEAVTA